MKHLLSIFFCVVICLSSCQEHNFNALLIHYNQLDKSLQKSNAFIHAASKNLVDRMEEICKTKMQYQPLIEKAKKILAYETKLTQFIDSLKSSMIQETDGIYTKEEALATQDTLLEGLPKGAKNSSIVTKTLLTGSYEDQNNLPKAVLLDQKMQALSNQYIALLESCWNKEAVKGSLFSDPRKKASTIQALKDQFTLKTSQQHILTQEKDQTWAQSNFENKPLILVLNNLTAIQNDLKTTQYLLIDFFSNQIARLNYNNNYDRFEILTYSDKSSVRLGETYETQIALGAYSSKAVFDVIINKDTISAMDGKAIYRVRPNKIGQQEYLAKIKLTNPMTGETEVFSKTFNFEVIP